MSEDCGEPDGCDGSAWLSLVLLASALVLPVLYCCYLQRGLPQRHAVGDNVLVRRNGNRIGKQHVAVVLTVHKERRPLGAAGQQGEMEALYCFLDATTCNHFKPRSYDVQFESGGQEKAPEQWVLPLPAGTVHTLAALEGGGTARIETTVVATPVPGDTPGGDEEAGCVASA
jgi:hypothetical protein